MGLINMSNQQNLNKYNYEKSLFSCNINDGDNLFLNDFNISIGAGFPPILLFDFENSVLKEIKYNPLNYLE